MATAATATTAYSVNVSIGGGCSATGNVTLNVLPAGAGNILWTGAVSTDWFDPANWDCGGGLIPTPTSNVYIYSGASNYPVVTNNITVKSLYVNPSASFTMGSGFTLTLIP